MCTPWICSLLVEMTSVSDVLVTVPSMGVRLCSVLILPEISGQRKPWMLPSGHVCPWFYSFDPLLIFRRRIFSLVPCWCQSQLFKSVLSVCSHLQCDPHGEVWSTRGNGCLSSEKCLPQSRVNSVVLRIKHGSIKILLPILLAGFLRCLDLLSQVLLSHLPQPPDPPELALGFEPSLALFFPQVWQWMVSGGSQLGLPPTPFSSWTWILPNQG